MSFLSARIAWAKDTSLAPAFNLRPSPRLVSSCRRDHLKRRDARHLGVLDVIKVVVPTAMVVAPASSPCLLTCCNSYLCTGGFKVVWRRNKSSGGVLSLPPAASSDITRCRVHPVSVAVASRMFWPPLLVNTASSELSGAVCVFIK